MAGTAELDELRRLDRRAYAAALRNGLEPCETIFQLASADRMYDIVARGLPGRYAHWRFGRTFDQHRAHHDRGLSRVYELVLNTRPAQAYLLDGNTTVMQLLVIAHVYAHVDFFCRSRHFEVTDPAFLRRVRAAASRIEQYAREHGRDRVEDLIDAGTALSPHRAAGTRPTTVRRGASGAAARRLRRPLPGRGGGAPAAVEGGARRLGASACRASRSEDLLGFLVREAPRLEDWERDVLGICREEAAYFAPQLRTKIINEGWATYWHIAILQDLQLPADQFVEFQRATAHGRAAAPRRGQPVQPRLRPVAQGRAGLHRADGRGSRALAGRRRGARARAHDGDQRDVRRRGLHRRVPDRGRVRGVQALRLAARRVGRAPGHEHGGRRGPHAPGRGAHRLRHPAPRDHRRRRLPQRRAVARAPPRGRRARPGVRARHAAVHRPPVGAARAPALGPRQRRPARLVRRRAGRPGDDDDARPPAAA